MGKRSKPGIQGIVLRCVTDGKDSCIDVYMKIIDQIMWWGDD